MPLEPFLSAMASINASSSIGTTSATPASVLVNALTNPNLSSSGNQGLPVPGGGQSGKGSDCQI